MKKVLIIGGTGTISTPITERLIKDLNIDLFILNRGNHNSKLNAHYSFINADINNTNEVKESIKDLNFDCVINFIIFTKQQALNNIEIFKNKTKQFIHISTNAVINHEITCLINEENEKGNHYSTYGKQKAEIEDLLLNNEESFPVTIVRPTQTYSDNRIPLSIKGNGCYSVISRMIQGKEVIIHGDGQSVWSSTHALDFVKGFYPLINNLDTIGEIYSIVNDESHTWDKVYQILAKKLNVDYKPVYISTELLRHSKKYDLEGSVQGDKRWSNIFDTSKIKTISPEFECSITIEKGLQMYLDYLENHPEAKIEEPEFDAWCDETIRLYKESMQSFIKYFK